MSFRFRLDSVARLRQLQYNQSLGQLTSVIREEVQLAALVRERQTALDAAYRKLRVSPGVTTDAAFLREQAQRTQELSAGLVVARTAVEAIEVKRTKAQQAVAKCRSELKALTQLRTRAEDEYRAAELRLDQKRIDELSSIAHGVRPT